MINHDKKHPNSLSSKIASGIPTYLTAVIMPLILAVIASFRDDREQTVWIASIGAALVFLLWATSVFILWIINKKEENNNFTADKAFDVFRFKPYSGDERDIFFRPDKVQEKLVEWVRSSEESILYLTGPSGTGKTSLLRAWLVPELQKRDPEVNLWVVDNLGSLEERAREGEEDRSPPQVFEKITDFIKKRITEVAPDILREDNTDSIRDLLERATSLSPGKLIVAIDQFGSSLLIQNNDERERFASFFKDLEERPIRGLTLLLVMRSDRLDLGNLPYLNLPDTTLPGNRFEVRPLLHHEAIELLEHIADELLPDQRERIIEEAKEIDQGAIRPVTLNIAGKALQSSSRSAPNGRLVEMYLRQVLTRAGYEDYVPKILDAMITQQGRTRRSTVKTLADRVGMDTVTVQKFLRSLKKEGLVRSLDAPKDTTWEITHSFLAEQLDRIIPRLRPSWWDYIRRGMMPLAFGSIVLLVAVSIPKFTNDRRVSEIKNSGISIVKEDQFYAVVLKGEAQISRIQDIEKLGSAITSLEISHSDKVNEIPNLDSFDNLQKLTIVNNDGIVDIDGLENLGNLNTLVIDNNDQLKNVNVIEKLSNLETIDISNNTQLDSLPRLDSINNLQVLMVRNNESLKSVPSLKNIDSLKELWIMNNTVLDEIPELGVISRFTEIALGSIPNTNNDEEDTWFDKSLELLKEASVDTTILVSRDSLRRGWQKKLNESRSKIQPSPGNATVEPW